MDQLDLIDLYRTFHPKTMNFTFFSSVQRTFSRIVHNLSHKSRLQFSSVQLPRNVDSFRPHEPQHARPPYSSPTAGSTQTHVHWVSDAIQPFRPLSPLSPPALNLSQHQSLFQWVPKAWYPHSNSQPAEQPFSCFKKNRKSQIRRSAGQVVLTEDVKKKARLQPAWGTTRSKQPG